MSRSNVDLFLTNLRLLKLNSLPDWPEITTQAFSTRDVNQNQKSRIRATEWALYRLFELWDVEETRNKLQPFFPPFEPLQSVNLRAALFRCLNEVKKTGVLGREIVLRKTMLDECKGDKFFEVLAIFSTAVLRRCLLESSHGRVQGSIVRSLVTASSLSPSEQSLLLPLAITYKSALERTLEGKAAASARYNEFSKVLDAKIGDISQTTEQYTASLLKFSKPQDHRSDTNAIRKHVAENWHSDPQWLDIVLHGDTTNAGDGILEQSFADTWQQVKDGRLLQQRSAKSHLLNELEGRVKLQQSRIRRWEAFHQKISQSNNRDASDPGTIRGDATRSNTSGFEAHKQYRTGTGENSSMLGANSEDIMALGKPVYREILEIMTQSLPNSSTAIRRSISSRDEQSRSNSPLTKHVQYSRSKNSGKPSSNNTRYNPKVISTSGASSRLEGSNNAHTTLPLIKPEEHCQTVSSSKSPVKNRTLDIFEQGLVGNDLDMSSSTTHDYTASLLVHGPLSVSQDSEQDTIEDLLEYSSDSKGEFLVNQIISSVAEASPSPIKKPYLSLTERTRLSMAHMFAPDASPQASNRDFESPSVSHQVLMDSVPKSRRQTLEERTRQSMSYVAAFPERAKPKQRQSMSMKTRQSLYPVNQFETPRKECSIVREEEHQSGKSTPKEVLFSEDAEYESVFKSRPKIAMSPIQSPNEETLDEAEHSPFEEETSDLWVMSSPLASRHPGNVYRSAMVE